MEQKDGEYYVAYRNDKGRGHCIYTTREGSNKVDAILEYGNCRKEAQFTNVSDLEFFIKNYIDKGECPSIPGERIF